jgi:hypothetical protein
MKSGVTSEDLQDFILTILDLMSCKLQTSWKDVTPNDNEFTYKSEIWPLRMKVETFV